MTIGERIAEQRKKSGMSQEALGEALGISRQAISKWEAGATFPELEKIIVMCRLFHISSDQLLGLKEILPGPKDKASPSGISKKKKGIWIPRRLFWITFFVLLLFILGGIGIFSRQAAVRKRQLTDLQSDLAHLQFETNQTCRPELIAQNREEISDWDPEENTIRISFLMTLQQVTEDTSVQFVAEVDGIPYYSNEARNSGSGFEADIRCPLGDQIYLYTVFYQDGKTTVEALDRAYGWESATMYHAEGKIFHTVNTNDSTSMRALTDTGIYITGLKEPSAPIAAGKVRLVKVTGSVYKNGEELVSADASGIPGSEPSEKFSVVRFPDLPLSLSPGDRLAFLLSCTDQLGRTSYQVCGNVYQVKENLSMEVIDPAEISGWYPDSEDHYNSFH